jgi:UPF0176 protein
LPTFCPKESWSDTQPFKKMLVKVKGEIIRMNHPTIRPADGRAPAVAPATLKRWLDQGFDDEGRPVVTLDTRNDFEVDAGTFDGTIDWRITKFTEFPASPAGPQGRPGRQNRGQLLHRRHPLRESRHPDARSRLGLNVYQLEGGILKYFEETDGSHYHGGCFVFDERRAVDAHLIPNPEAVNG